MTLNLISALILSLILNPLTQLVMSVTLEIALESMFIRASSSESTLVNREHYEELAFHIAAAKVATPGNNPKQNFLALSDVFMNLY